MFPHLHLVNKAGRKEKKKSMKEGGNERKKRSQVRVRRKVETGVKEKEKGK